MAGGRIHPAQGYQSAKGERNICFHLFENENERDAALIGMTSSIAMGWEYVQTGRLARTDPGARTTARSRPHSNV